MTRRFWAWLIGGLIVLSVTFFSFPTDIGAVTVHQESKQPGFSVPATLLYAERSSQPVALGRQNAENLVSDLTPDRLPTVLSQDADPISWDEYWKQIDGVVALLEDSNPDGVAEAATRLASLQSVRLPDGRVVTVDHDDWAAMLRDGDVSAVHARLLAMQGAQSDLAVRRQTATSDTWERLDRILSRPEFSQAPRPAGRSFLQDALDALRRWMTRWLDRVAAAPGVEYLVALLAGGVVLAVLVYVLRDGWRGWVAEGRVRGDSSKADLESVSSDEALQRAQMMASAADYRHAVRLLYLSVLLRLDESRLLRIDPALTNGEYLTQAVDQPALHAALIPVVEGFDRVWYGFGTIDGRGYAAYLRQVERVRQVEQVR